MATKPKAGKSKLTVTGKKEKLTPEERIYFRELHKLIDDIFTEAAEKFDWTWNQLAEQAGVSYYTVVNLGERVTRYPRYHTVHRLARAVGWSLTAGAQPKKIRLKKAG